MSTSDTTDSIAAQPDHFDYVVEVSGWENILDQDTKFVHRVPVDAVADLIRGLMTAYESVVSRQRDDAAAGDCEKCGNSRMVYVERPYGQPWCEHCPVCTPLIEAARARKGSTL